MSWWQLTYGSGEEVLSGSLEEIVVVVTVESSAEVEVEELLLAEVIDVTVWELSLAVPVEEGLAVEYPIAPGRDVLMQEQAEAR